MRISDLEKIGAALTAKSRSKQFEFRRLEKVAISAEDRVREIAAQDDQAKKAAAGAESLADIQNALRYQAGLTETLKSARAAVSNAVDAMESKRQELGDAKLREIVADRLAGEAWKETRKRAADFAERQRESLSMMRPAHNPKTNV